jgi:SAM-dependent methyltransferase
MLRLRERRARRPSVDELIPPERALPPYTKKGDFKRAGASFLETAVEKGLQPHHRVLDLGCGVGRFAVALSEYLDERGRYVGLDTAQKSIRLCNRWIGSKLPGFSFVWADVFNTNYNRGAAVEAARYRFPFENRAFDFVFSNSLFTHLVPSDARNYFEEIGRVLKPDARTLNTIFLLNGETLALIDRGESPQGVLHDLGGIARVKEPDNPEAWIALDEGFVRNAHDEAGLRIAEVRYGGWPGREASGPGFGKKDIVLAVKSRREGPE